MDEAPLAWKARDPIAIWQDVQSALHRLLDETSAAAQLLPQAYTPDQAAPETWLPQPQLTAFHQALHALSTEITEHIRNQGLEVQGHRSFTAYSSRSSRPRYKF